MLYLLLWQKITKQVSANKSRKEPLSNNFGGRMNQSDFSESSLARVIKIVNALTLDLANHEPSKGG